MILVFSEQNDVSTNEVCDWFSFYNIPFIRFCEFDKIKINSISICNNGIFGEMEICNLHISISQITSVWYRRGEPILEYINIEKIDFLTNGLENQVSKHLQNEVQTIKQFFLDFLTRKTITSFEHRDVNKLLVLEKAIKCGLKVPKTYLITKKTDLLTIFKKRKLITKSIQNIPFYFISQPNMKYIGYTGIINELIINKIPDEFFPSLLQEMIEKEFEVRTFVFFDKLYSMAIFSQSDPRTNIDFRIYNFFKPNRCVPFILPKVVHKKIIALMKNMNMNCGSIDIIYSKDGNFYFLEINPVGQFGMVSKPCNYFLEKKIAKHLCHSKTL